MRTAAGVFVGLFALLAFVRVAYQVHWNAEHTGYALGYQPLETLFPLFVGVPAAIGAIAIFATRRAG